MDTVLRGADTGQSRHDTARARSRHGADQSSDEAMTDAIYVRLPQAMATDVRSRAEQAGQGAAEWVRGRIARSLQQPALRPQQRLRPTPSKELVLLVDVQRVVASVGIALRKAHDAEASFGETVALSLPLLESASYALVAAINVMRKR